MAELSPSDPDELIAFIKREHQSRLGDSHCFVCLNTWPCVKWRLADMVASMSSRLKQVNYLVETWDGDSSTTFTASEISGWLRAIIEDDGSGRR